jgi:hypothetical protein
MPHDVVRCDVVCGNVTRCGALCCGVTQRRYGFGTRHRLWDAWIREKGIGNVATRLRYWRQDGNSKAEFGALNAKYERMKIQNYLFNIYNLSYNTNILDYRWGGDNYKKVQFTLTNTLVLIKKYYLSSGREKEPRAKQSDEDMSYRSMATAYGRFKPRDARVASGSTTRLDRLFSKHTDGIGLYSQGCKVSIEETIEQYPLQIIYLEFYLWKQPS